MGIVSLKSNLAIKGTPEKYDTKGVLGNLTAETSNLNIDNVPDKYDTRGVLGNLTAETSNLNLDNVPDKYDIRGVLGNLDDPGGKRINYSRLDIDTIPGRYDTIGKLGFLPKGASRLDFDSPLPAQVDNFTNTNAKGFTLQNPIGVTQFINDGQTSTYGLLGIPTRYDITGKLGFLPKGASQLDFDSVLPAPVDNFEDVSSKGFTIKNPVGVSQFVGILGNTYTNPNGLEIITNPGIGVDFFNNGNARGFTIKARVGVTQFKDGGQTSRFGFASTTPPSVDFFTNINAKGFNIKNPIGISRFINNGQTSRLGFTGTTPSPVNFFTNTNSKGFTIQNPIGVSQFINNGQTSRFGFAGSTAPAVDFLANTNAIGFNIKNPIGVTRFQGIQGNTYTNPNGTIINTTPGPGINFIPNIYANGFTIKNPIGITQFKGINGNTFTNPSGKGLGFVNFFPNELSGAKGFKEKLALYETRFIGVSANNEKYEYPALVKGARLLNVSLGSSNGTAKLNNQLGAGSPKFGNKGWSDTNPYTTRGGGGGTWTSLNATGLEKYVTAENSPLTTAYTYSEYYGHDLKLRSTAYNPTYMAHPLILRGLQNPNQLGPQRWGLTAGPQGQSMAGGLVAALDGGFIRGGASTAVERAALDTARIAKFMASPKGIIWLITQVGLGKSNPLVEKNPLNTLPFNDTRSHSGLTTLLSVPGSPFGLHFTRHGIPFLNEAASYEQVIKYNTDNIGLYRKNRLYLLKKELFSNKISDPSKLLESFQRVSNSIKGSENPIIQTISGLGGPGSVYGIGATNIRRYVNTSLENQLSREVDEIKKELTGNTDLTFGRYNYFKRYAPGLNQNKTKQGTIAQDKENSKEESNTNESILDTSEDKSKGLVKKLLDTSKTTNPWNPGNGNNPGTDASPNLNTVKANDTNDNSGNSFSVMPYNEIRAIAKGRTSTTTTINDFRSKFSNKKFLTSADVVKYETANLRDRYGFGNHGKPGVDKSNPYNITDDNGNIQTGKGNIDDTITTLKTKSTDPENTTQHHSLANKLGFRGDKINAIDYVPESNKVKVDDIYPDKSSDFIKFYFGGIDLYGVEKDDVVVFRASVKGISDSFSPSWNTVSIMGRPDGPAIYSSFERSVSFNFSVAATSREELVPMWRKLNYLSTYTMPIYGAGRPGGALCRLTIGNMFQNTPGYFTGLTISVNDEASWDLAEDYNEENNTYTKANKYGKQLPNLVDVDVSFKIIHDYRPQKGGRSYHLYDGNITETTQDGSWLWDSNI